MFEFRFDTRQQFRLSVNSATRGTIILFSRIYFFGFLVLVIHLIMFRLFDGSPIFSEYSMTLQLDRVNSLIFLFFGFLIGLFYFDIFHFSLFLKNTISSSIWNAWKSLYRNITRFSNGDQSIGSILFRLLSKFSYWIEHLFALGFFIVDNLLLLIIQTIFSLRPLNRFAHDCELSQQIKKIDEKIESFKIMVEKFQMELLSANNQIKKDSKIIKANVKNRAIS